jgi:RHS repeat-associated protein
MNKLSAVTNGASTASFQYNDQGIRVRTMMGASTTYYLVDANNHTGYQQVLEEFSTLRSMPTISYVLGDDVLAQAASETASYLLYDGHGNTRQMADNAGGVTSHYNYDAYGVAQTTSSSAAEYAADHGNSLLYCGEHYDSALRMYNLRARYYNPGNGRFNQRDMFEGNNDDPQNLHKYIYATDNPIDGVDPSGNLTLIQVMIAISILLSIAFTFYDGWSAARDYQRGDYGAYVRDEAWTMVDLASLMEPGGGFLDGGAKLAYQGSRATESAEGLLRARVPAASVWGYVRAMASMASSGASEGPRTSKSGSSSGSPDDPGEWQKEDQSNWPKGAEEYQCQITKRQGQCYFYNGVRWDGWDPVRKVLLEAKNGYAWELEPWAQKLDFPSAWREWAKGRVAAAGKIPVEVNCSVKEFADMLRDATEGTGVKVVYTPATTVY